MKWHIILFKKSTGVKHKRCPVIIATSLPKAMRKRQISDPHQNPESQKTQIQTFQIPKLA